MNFCLHQIPLLNEKNLKIRRKRPSLSLCEGNLESIVSWVKLDLKRLFCLFTERQLFWILLLYDITCCVSPGQTLQRRIWGFKYRMKIISAGKKSPPDDGDEELVDPEAEGEEDEDELHGGAVELPHQYRHQLVHKSLHLNWLLFRIVTFSVKKCI